MTLVDGLVLLFIWAMLLVSPSLRTARAAALWVAISIVFVGSGWFGIPVSSIARLGVVLLSGAVFLGLLPWFPVPTAASRRMHQQLRATMRDVDDAHRQWSASVSGELDARRSAREATARAARDAVGRIGSLEPPTESWRIALDGTKTYLEALYRAASPMEVNVPPDTEARDVELAEARSRMDRAWNDAIRLPR